MTAVRNEFYAFGKAMALFPGAWFYGLLWFHPQYFRRFWETENRMAKIDERYGTLARLDFYEAKNLLRDSNALDEFILGEIARLQQAWNFLTGRALGRLHTLRSRVRRIVARVMRHRPRLMKKRFPTGRNVGAAAIGFALLCAVAQGVIGTGALVDMFRRVFLALVGTVW